MSELIGPVAGRLHMARLCNDQVAFDFCLWVHETLQRIAQALKGLIKQLLVRAEQHVDSSIPGFVYLQSKQLVTFGHYIMAYVEMFAHDLSRMRDAIERMDESPLGAVALAGTSSPIDRFMTARVLGFYEPTRNSIDSVSGRVCLGIFKRWCSLYYASFAFGRRNYSFVRCFFLGSSIMPQKRNLDAAELIRTKAGRLNDILMGLLTVMKGLPFAYLKDRQEDKEYVFGGALI